LTGRGPADNLGGMKIAVSGKGGTGKTTLAGMLALYLAGQGRPVIAVDADPAASLASALGLRGEDAPAPISEMRELILERTGASEGYGSFFKLNPRVDDLPERFSATVRGVRLLVLGGVKSGGSGCICPESALLRALVSHLILRQDETVIMDMEAGIEHLGRATARAVDRMIVMVEPGLRSVSTALAVRRLATEIGLVDVVAVANKVRPETDLGAIRAALGDLELAGVIPYDQAIAEADMRGESPYTGSPAQVAMMEALAARILGPGRGGGGGGGGAGKDAGGGAAGTARKASR